VIDAFFTSMDAGMNDILGSEAVTLRSSLRLTRPNGSVATDLRVAQVAHAGDASIVLRSADGPLEGYVGEGLAVTVGGHAYAVTADCQRSANGTVAVSVTPDLMAGAAVDDPAMIAETMDRTAASCLVYKPLNSVIQGDLVGIVSFAVSIPTSSLVLPPRIGDTLTSSLGSGALLGFLPSDGGSWEALVGRAGTPATELPRRQAPARTW